MSTVPTDNNDLNEESPAPDKNVTGTEEAAPIVSSATTRSSSKRHLISFILLGMLVLAVLGPGGVTLGYGVTAYTTYAALRSEAYSGVQHLLTVKTLFAGVKEHPAELLDAGKLHKAQQELVAARQDFQQVQFTLDHSGIIHTVTSYFPQYRGQVIAARTASQMGIDVVYIGQTLAATALKLAPTFRGPLLKTSGKPLITMSMIDLLQRTLDAIMPPLNDIQAKAHTLDMNALPVSAAQRQQFQQLVQALPLIMSGVQEARDLLGAAPWLLGINSPRTFLVQTLDPGELRATGGFTGQYGELQISNGRVESFFLRDISLVEYTDNSPTLGQLPPQQYRSWWPFANWGLRDSNLSADFPTSAQLALSLYKEELGRQVDGVIVFTPTLIEQILQVVGPIYVPGYDETITPQNLQARLYYYQEDPAGTQKQSEISAGDTSASATSTSVRKRFTALLAQLLMDRVRQASSDAIFAIARQMFSDLKTKDLQVYFTNPQVEALLMRYGDAAQIDRSTTHDGLLVVQDNLSANKSSEYVQTTLQDTVTLDAAGGALHVLHMQLAYKPDGPIYGYQTYFDYVRVYVPPTSEFLWGDGFDSGVPLCGGYYSQSCPQNGVYPNNELVCPPGQYEVGAGPPSTFDPDGATLLPFDEIGPPTNFSSDELGRAMFGGWVIVPRNCIMNVTLSWYVPRVGSNPYALLVQNQAGTLPKLDLTILPDPGDCLACKTAGLHVDMILREDTMFTLKKAGS